MPQAQDTKPLRSRAAAEDTQAIGALVEAFTKAFDAGDAAAVAATFTAGALVVDEEGERHLGRAAIRDQFAASFKHPRAARSRSRSTRCASSARRRHSRRAGPPSLRAMAPGHPRSAASPQCTSRKTATGSRPRFATKRPPTSSVHDRLKELEWLVGEWVNESQDAVVFTTCKWADNGNFLLREFTVKTQGRPVMSGSQRIGWDPVKRQFKSWVFDTEGGFVEAYWTRDGNQWLIKAEGVQQNGEPASATNIITRLGKDRIGWQTVNRTLGGAAVPGVDEFTLVRKPPEISK